jgi:N-acylneuraminate cytidylyltransferase/CMP-N,N'-diacetyllegionaminic acid synthase
MFEGKHIAAIIPARNGSKGLPGKNIKLLCGKPLIEHTLDCCRKSGIVDLMVLSTDSRKIAETIKAPDVSVLIRPAELATDDAKGIDVFIHAVEWIKANHRSFDYFFYLQPTSPLRAPFDLVGAVETAIDKDADTVIGVTPCEHPPYWTNTLPSDRSMKDFIRPEIMGQNRQELPTFYRLNGAIYLVKNRNTFQDFSFFSERTYAYVMPNERSVDIDSKIDFALAEVLLRESTIS